MQGGYAHLRHHLHHPLGHSFLVSGDEAVFGGVFIAKQAFFVCLPERFKSQIRIDSVGTVSGQQTVMMDFSGFTGFDHNADLASQFIVKQVLMDSAGGNQRTQRNPGL